MNIVKGDIFTISPNKNGDRSYIDRIFRAVEMTETQIWAKEETSSYGLTDKGANCLIKSEHDFFRVSEDALKTIKAAQLK